MTPVSLVHNWLSASGHLASSCAVQQGCMSHPNAPASVSAETWHSLLTPEPHLVLCKSCHLCLRLRCKSQKVFFSPPPFNSNTARVFHVVTCSTSKKMWITVPVDLYWRPGLGFPRHPSHFFVHFSGKLKQICPQYSHSHCSLPQEEEQHVGSWVKYMCVCLLVSTSAGPHSPRFRADAYPTWQPVANTAPGWIVRHPCFPLSLSTLLSASCQGCLLSCSPLWPHLSQMSGTAYPVNLCVSVSVSLSVGVCVYVRLHSRDSLIGPLMTIWRHALIDGTHTCTHTVTQGDKRSTPRTEIVL